MKTLLKFYLFLAFFFLAVTCAQAQNTPFPEKESNVDLALGLGENRLTVFGDLTIKGKTLPIELDVEISESGAKTAFEGFAFYCYYSENSRKKSNIRLFATYTQNYRINVRFDYSITPDSTGFYIYFAESF